MVYVHGLAKKVDISSILNALFVFRLLLIPVLIKAHIVLSDIEFDLFIFCFVSSLGAFILVDCWLLHSVRWNFAYECFSFFHNKHQHSCRFILLLLSLCFFFKETIPFLFPPFFAHKHRYSLLSPFVSFLSSSISENWEEYTLFEKLYIEFAHIHSIDTFIFHILLGF